MSQKKSISPRVPLTGTSIGGTLSARVYRVDLSKVERKLAQKVPVEIRQKLRQWSQAVIEDGLLETRKLPAYHDEPLKGSLRGQRSIRLSRKWRAYYIERDDGKVVIVEVQKVDAHEYRTKR